MQFIYLLFRLRIDFFDVKDFHKKFGRWIWSEKGFKGNLMLQFSWLEDFRKGNVSVWWAHDELQYQNDLNDQL